MTDAKRRILVVDDEPVIRLFLQELLEDEGYEVVTAQSIAEGTEALRTSRFHLVVTDKNLPDGTGFEIVHAAKEQDPPCEAMIITGYASLDSAVMALQIGAYDYILKPIEDVDLLLEKARKAIEKQDMWCELMDLRRRAGVSEAPGSGTAAPGRPDGETQGSGFLGGVEGGVPQLMKLAELGSLIPMLAHELRQPLAGVKGYVDLLLHKKDLPETYAPKLESMREQLAHMATLIDSITSYSRAGGEGGKPFALGGSVERALSIFPALLGNGRYQFQVEVAPDLPPARGSANALQQVVVNLVKNAKDALDEAGGGRLHVSCWHDVARDELCIRVEDEGPGIAPEARDRLFQPFFTTKDEGIGTGLGLTICRQIVESHGGSIDVESPLAAEGGTAFTVRLPAARDAALAAS